MKKNSIFFKSAALLFCCLMSFMGLSFAQTTYVFNTYPAGVQYAVNEVHVLDNDVTIVTNDCHFTNEIRVYSNSANDGNFYSYALPFYIDSLAFNMGYKVDNVNIFGSTDGSTWTLVGTISVTSTAYANYGISFGSNDYHYFKFDVAGTQQIRVKNMTIYYKSTGPSGTAAQAPTISPESGFNTNPVTVTITSETSNASIYYTTDGTTPTDASTLYTAPFTVNQTTTVKAIVTAPGYMNSAVATATYTFPVTVNSIAEFKTQTADDQPFLFSNDVTYVFGQGSYTYVKDASGGLLIYGNTITTPFNEGDQISGLIGNHSVHNSQVEMISAQNPAPATSNTGVVSPIVVTMSDLIANYNNYDAQLITLENVTFPNGFTGSNQTTITQGESSMTLYKRFTLDTTLAANTTLNVTGFAAVYNNSIQIYPRNNQDLSEYIPTIPPTLTITAPADGSTFSTLDTLPVNISIENFTLGTDGYLKVETPLLTAIGLTNPVYLDQTGLNALMMSTLSPLPAGTHTITCSLVDMTQAPLTPAVTATTTFTVTMPQVDAPVFTPSTGTYADAVTFSLSCATDGAVIRYTTNGTVPTETSTLYSTPVTLTATTTVKAKAFKATWLDSEVAIAEYTIVYDPVLTVDATALTFTSTQLTQTFTVGGAHLTDPITLTCNDTHFTVSPTTITNPNGNTTVTVTFDGTEPATGNIAVVSGTQSAQVALTATAQLPAPVMTPATEISENAITVTMSCSMSNAEIRYTTDGTDPNATSTVYSSPVTFTTPGNYTLKAIAVLSGWENSNVTTGTYTINEPPAPDTVHVPTITPATGTYYEPQTVTITCTDADAEIRYTTDGTEPNETSTLYSAPFTVSTATTINAKAWKTGMIPSGTATVTISFPEQVANIAAFKAAAATNQERQIMSDVTFVFRSGRFMYVEDNTAALLIYDYNTPVITTQYNEGDVIEGGIFGKYTLYQGMVEMLPTHNANAATGTPVTVTPANATITQIKTNYTDVYEAKLVHLSDVEFISATQFVQNGDTMAIYNRFNTLTTEISAGDIADVTGFVSYSNNYGYQIYPRGNDDIDIHPIVIADTVATPVFYVYRSGEFYFMNLTCATDGASIYYTYDGTDPDENAIAYTSDAPFQTNVHYILKAVAMKEGMVNSEIAVYDYDPTGIVNHELRDNLSAYPNPATDNVIISVQNDNLTIEKVELFNIYGQLLRTVEVNSTMTEISVGTLATGTYFAKVFTDKGITTMPVIRK